MTDKEIIIDGVDISTCIYHSSTTSSELCYMRGNKCNENPNCYYKQLQCEKKLNKVNLQRSLDLNRELGSLDAECDLLERENCKLKQECEELKKENIKLMTGKFKELGRALDAEKFYKQALEKIEGILSNHNEPGYSFCDTRCQLILDILNEVKESSTSNNVDKKAP